MEPELEKAATLLRLASECIILSAKGGDGVDEDAVVDVEVYTD